MSLTDSQCEEFWQIADKNHDDELTIQELKGALQRYEPSISDCQCAGIFCGLDSDNNRKVTKKEFLKEMRDKPSRSKHLNDMFRKYDSDNNGQLPRGEVMALIREYFKEDQVCEIIGLFLQHSDMNKDLMVSKSEFDEFFGC